MQGGYAQTGVNKKRHGTLGSIDFKSGRPTLFLHDPTHCQLRYSLTIRVAGKTKESADHCSALILGTSPKTRLGILGTIQITLLFIDISLQQLQNTFRL